MVKKRRNAAQHSTLAEKWSVNPAFCYRVFGCRDEVGWDGTDLGRAVFGWEASRVEDIPHANIPIRCRASPSLEISWTGMAPSGMSRERALSGRRAMRRREERRPWSGMVEAGRVEVHG